MNFPLQHIEIAMFDFDNRKVRCVLALLIPLFVACGTGVSPAARNVSSSTQNLEGPNGMEWNGMEWNGMEWNGADFLGVSVTGVQLNAEDISNVHLDGTVLWGTYPCGASLSACDFVGAHLRGLLSDSNVVDLRIDGYDLSSDPEISFYTVSYWNPVSHDWKPLCGNDTSGAPIKATALAGRWNYSQGVAGGGSYISNGNVFTFACEHSVLHKCTDWGYKPWKSLALAKLHQSCTRMVRADYCGDGTAYTTNGTAINYYDWDGIAFDDAPCDWIGDAEW